MLPYKTGTYASSAVLAMYCQFGASYWSYKRVARVRLVFTVERSSNSNLSKHKHKYLMYTIGQDNAICLYFGRS